MVEVLVATEGTHILFLYREAVPLCFITLKAGGGEGKGRGRERKGVAKADPWVPHVQHGPGLYKPPSGARAGCEQLEGQEEGLSLLRTCF